MTPSGIKPVTFRLGHMMGFGKYGHECAFKTEQITTPTAHTVHTLD